MRLACVFLETNDSGSRPRSGALPFPFHRTLGEGSRRKKRNVFLNHLDIALGSQAEVEVQLEIAYRLRFLPAIEYKRTQTAVEEIGRMLNGLIMSLQPESD